MAGVKIEDVRKFALEKELDEDLAFQIVEQTLKAAYKTAFKTDINAVVITGDDAVNIYARKKIVDDVVNPVLEVDIEEATNLLPTVNSETNFCSNWTLKILSEAPFRQVCSVCISRHGKSKKTVSIPNIRQKKVKLSSAITRGRKMTISMSILEKLKACCLKNFSYRKKYIIRTIE